MRNVTNAGNTDISPERAPTAKAPATGTPTSSGTRAVTEVEVVIVVIVVDRPAENEDVDEVAPTREEDPFTISKVESPAAATAAMEEDQEEAEAEMDEDPGAAAKVEKSIK